VPVADVYGKNAIGFQSVEVELKGFFRSKVVRDRIAAVGVDVEHVVERRTIQLFACKHPARVSWHEVDQALRIVKKGEVFDVLCDIDDLRIQLVETVEIVLASIHRHHARTESDYTDLHRLVTPIFFVGEQRDSRAERHVVRQRIGAVRIVSNLDSMRRLSVPHVRDEHPCAVDLFQCFRDADTAVEVALAVEFNRRGTVRHPDRASDGGSSEEQGGEWTRNGECAFPCKEKAVSAAGGNCNQRQRVLPYLREQQRRGKRRKQSARRTTNRRAEIEARQESWCRTRFVQPAYERGASEKENGSSRYRIREEGTRTPFATCREAGKNRKQRQQVPHAGQETADLGESDHVSQQEEGKHRDPNQRKRRDIDEQMRHNRVEQEGEEPRKPEPERMETSCRPLAKRLRLVLNQCWRRQFSRCWMKGCQTTNQHRVNQYGDGESPPLDREREIGFQQEGIDEECEK